MAATRPTKPTSSMRRRACRVTSRGQFSAEHACGSESHCFFASLLILVLFLFSAAGPTPRAVLGTSPRSATSCSRIGQRCIWVSANSETHPAATAEFADSVLTLLLPCVVRVQVTFCFASTTPCLVKTSSWIATAPSIRSPLLPSRSPNGSSSCRSNDNYPCSDIALNSTRPRRPPLPLHLQRWMHRVSPHLLKSMMRSRCRRRGISEITRCEATIAASPLLAASTAPFLLSIPLLGILYSLLTFSPRFLRSLHAAPRSFSLHCCPCTQCAARLRPCAFEFAHFEP